MITATIDGVEQEIALDGLAIERTANGRDVLRCQVISEDASVRPGLDDEIILEDDATSAILFAGQIIGARERGAGGQPIEAIATDITANDYKVLAARRHVNETIPTGTLKAALIVVVAYLPGVTLDAGQVNGPTLEELIYADVKTEDVLNDLAILSGYIWEIDENKELRMFEAGTVACPFNVIESAQVAIGDVSVEPRRDSSYANRVIVRNATIRVTAEDAAEITAHGEWEVVYQAADTLAEDALQALADAILVRSTPILKELEYRIDDLRARPGMTQTITLPSRHVNNTFLIGDVSIAPEPGSEELWARITAIEGLVYQTGWRETYKRWNAGGRGVNAATGTGGIPAAIRFAYFLGASGVEAVRSPTPTWVPVSGGPALGDGAVQVQINTIPRGTTAATITARLRAVDALVTVKARLYDVTDATPVPGESATVTSTAWELVTWGVTLTPGSHVYELQLLPGTADADVMGVGYLE